MKNILKKMTWVFLPLLSILACSPDEPESLSEGSIPKISDVNVSVSVDDKGVATFHIDKTNLAPIWYVNVGKDTVRAAYNDFQYTFNLPGNYSVDVKVYNKNGVSDGSVKKEFNVAKTKTLNFLTGGSSKTWKWDYTQKGHIGCGPSGTNGLSWWSAGANEKASTGMYDDELTFTAESKYTFDPGPDGLIYVNKDSKYKPEYYIAQGQDYDAPCTKVTTNFQFVQSGSNLFIQLEDVNTMVSYIPNPDALSMPKYKVLALNDTLLELTHDNGGIAWHYRFTPKK
jgi:hypothetical protein